MCAIAAIYSRDGEIGGCDGRITAMLAAMRRRGPDATSWRTWSHCALGNNRLRIRDLRATADQPMSGSRGHAHISFNGEIFNHIELRRHLESPSAGWATSSDTETLIAGYEQWGERVVERVSGQFAFAIFDERSRTLILARDRFGICPLYIAEVGPLVVAASSLRAIVRAFDGLFRTVDPLALRQYLLLRYTLAPRTIVEGIRQLSPGELAVFDGQSTRSQRYWSFRAPQASIPGSGDGVPELESAIEKSVAANCHSDAKVGVFLSGGLDSNLVAAVAARSLPSQSIATTISFAGSQDDETAKAAEFADRFGYRHQLALVPGDGDLMRETVDAMDVPCGARDAVAMHVLAKSLREVAPDCKVVLTGTGADELFGGYHHSYFGPVEGSPLDQMTQYLERYSAVQPGERTPLRALVDDCGEPDIARQLVSFAAAALPSLDTADPTRTLNLFYLVTHLAGWELCVADMMCMNQSLEARVPLLDPLIANIAMELAGSSAAMPGLEKLPLRRAARRWMPEAWCFRPKVPLSRPVAQWLAASQGASAWRPATLEQIGLDRVALGRVLAQSPSFDVWWRLFVLDRWIERNLGH